MDYYNSTRNNDIKVSASEAIINGLAPDGGLFVPEDFPLIDRFDLLKLSQMKYNERAYFILSQYLTDFTEPELKNCIDNAYNKEKFETDSIAPLYKLSNNMYILELWHGPTCAFKDMALQILPHFTVTASEKLGLDNETVILVATSGDTGKAALEGFRDVDNTKIIVFYPQSGVSRIQQLQMVTQEGSNVYVCAVNGNFDDAQNGVKAIFTDKEFAELLSKNKKAFSSANSINWGRLAPQIVYYFSAYADLIKNEEIKTGEEINIVVPTGNFGNILAAYYAKRMGLPVAKLICASNENNVLTDFINTGVYDKNREFKMTLSPSMDILISSNLERFLYDISGGDTEKINNFMSELKSCGRYDVGDEMRKKISDIFCAGYCNDSETLECIKNTQENYSYTLDTHTAVAVKVYSDYVKETGDNRKTVIASTASPYKFGQSVVGAIKGSEAVENKNDFDIIEMLHDVSGLKIPTSLAALKDKKIRFERVCKPNDMRIAVKDFLKI